MSRAAGEQATRPSASVLLWVLAGVSTLLLAYEGWTLVGSVWLPLLSNPQALQTDFHYYYDAAVRFSADRSRLYLASDDVIAGFAYPPPAIVPFMWLARWPLGTALLALSITSYLVLIGALQHWIRFLKREGLQVDRAANAAILITAIALGPAYMNAIFGQVNAFVLAAAIVFATMAAAASLEAGAALALGIWLKIYPAVLAATIVWDRRSWRALGWALAVMIAVALALLPIVPLEAYVTFVVQVLPARADKTAIHITNQSLVACLERFSYPPDKFLNWTGEQAVTVPAGLRALNWIIAATGVAWCWARARRGEPASAMASLIALIAVIAPLGWGHTYVMVLPLVILRLVEMRQAGTITAAATFACVVALMVPAGRHLPLDQIPGWLQNLFYSRYLVATVAMMGLTSAPNRRM